MMTRPTLVSLFLLLLLLVLPSPAHAGQWQGYAYTDQYRRLHCMAGKLYVLKSNSLVRADARTWQVEAEVTREDGLSRSSIVDACYSPELDCLALVYDDGMVDVLRPDGSIRAISDLYDAPMAATDKTILSVREQQGLLFLHTAYGFAVIDLAREVVLQDFHLGVPVACAWLFDGCWYYSAGKSTFYCPLRGGNPHHPDGWSLGSNHLITRAVVVRNGQAEQCWQLGADLSLRCLAPGSHASYRSTSANTYRDLRQAGPYLMAATCKGDSLVLFDTRVGPPVAQGSPLPAGQRLSCLQTGLYASAVDLCLLPEADASAQRPAFAFLYPSQGVRADSLVPEAASHFSLLPLFDHRTLSISNHQQSSLINTIVTDGHGQLAMTYAPSARVDYTKILQSQGFLTTLTPSSAEWTNYGASLVSAAVTSNKRFVGVTGLVADPDNPERYYFSTLEDGIVAVDHGKFLLRFNHTNTSGGLETCAYNCTRIGGIGLNREGDLWCFNEGHDYGLRVLSKAQGKWFRFRLTGLEQAYGVSSLCVTRHGSRHQVWGYEYFKHNGSYLFCYDYGADAADSRDDRYVVLRELTPLSAAEGAPFTPFYGRRVAEGPGGAIWLLNTSGLYVVDRPDTFLDHPGLVRTVSTAYVPTSMTVDSEQNVWVGTEAHGVYLLSSDGRRQLAHFDTTNSILASNEVSSVCFDSLQHTLWLASPGQVLSFAYAPGEFQPSAEAQAPSPVYCYPGRVRQGMGTQVHVFGLLDDSQVTLIDSECRTLWQGTALAQMVSIDTSRLPAGVYTVRGTDVNGLTADLTAFEVKP